MVNLILLWRLLRYFKNLEQEQKKSNDPVVTVPKKDVIILLPYLGLHSNHITKHLKSCVNRFYSFVNVNVIFQNTRRIKSFFPYKDRLNRSQLSKVIYKASCWDCNDFYIGKTKRRLHDRKTEEFKALLKKMITLCYCWSRKKHWSQHQMTPFWHFGVWHDWLPL